MWNGCYKAVTFSYDDGVTQDARLVELFNRYGLKCTFNLNSGIMSYTNCWEGGGISIHRMNAAGLPKLYRGHEIAVHTLTHPDLTKYDTETVRNEVLLDKQNLERIFDCEVVGMAYPYGTYNEEVIAVLRECGIRYSRTVEESVSTAFPADLLKLRPTAHHNHKKLLELARSFVEEPADQQPRLLYIWGHSYEFDMDSSWDRMEELCRILAGHDDIFYGTNREVLL